MADGHVVVGAAAEDVLRVAEPRTREPLGSRHLASGEHALVRLARLDLEELPDRRPELLELVDRPLPEVGVVAEGEPACLVEPLPVARDRRGGDPLGARLPDDRRQHGRDATREELATDSTSKRHGGCHRPGSTVRRCYLGVTQSRAFPAGGCHRPFATRYVPACWLTPALNMPPVAIFVSVLSACDSSSSVWSIRSLISL